MSEKIINICCEHHPYSNCIQDVVITFLKWKNHDFRLLFEHNWCFYFDGKLVDVYRSNFDDLFCSINNSYGYEPKFIDKFDSVENIKKIIDSNNICFILSDTYELYWHKTYKQSNNYHYLIVMGYNDNSLICIDPYTSKELYYLCFAELDNLIKSYFFFIKNNDEKPNSIKLQHIVKKTLTGFNNNSDFMQMRLFGQAVANPEFIKNELIKYNNLAFYPLLLRISFVSYSRKCFEIYLSLITNNGFYNLENYITEFFECANLFSKLSILFIKYIKSDFKISEYAKINELINYIADKEENMAYSLLNKLNT